ncbi:MAG: DUF1566 domain-containing protein [Flavobacteriales bacterium]|nr:DUF1566 domain-containing protein [Flavobacteriales bacterium]
MKKQVKTLSVLVLATGFLSTGCSKDEEKPIVTVENFVTSLAENPVMGQYVGHVNSSIENATSVGYYFTPEHTGIGEHIAMDRATGEMTVSNPSFFDFEQVTSISGTAEISAFDGKDNETRVSFSVTVNITDVIETTPPTVSVQERLNGGETPIDIYISNNSLLDSLYGKTYAGGLIAYLNTIGGNGFVVASNDQSTALIWDPNQPAGSGTAGTNDAIGNGPLNTNAIVNTILAGSYAAQACNDLVLNSFSDWFLPSRDELTEVYNNLHLNGYGNFQNISYWSSSETPTATIVWYRKFDTGQEGMGGSEQLFGVRAVRTF